ncbi:MAG TPA: lipopolysaccharide biosynthesis protein [Candidatus Limnocylindria bacterium]|nr:lipopolysaccharide biosynthesis protein [Candidatus Limnocylindria bacterium]
MNERPPTPPDRPATDGVPPRRPLARRLLGESAVYGLGGVASQALAIILVPIYARTLGVANYGTVAILTTTLSLSTLVVTLALPQAFFRSYLNEADDDRERAAVLRTAAGLRLVVSLLGALLLGALAIPLAVLLLGGGDDWLLIALLAVIVFFDTVNLVPLSLLRADRRPRAYAAISFSRAVLGSLLIVLFVVWLGLGVLGVVLGSLVSAAVSATAGGLLLARDGRLQLSLDRRLARHMLVFSLPLVPASVAGWTLNLSDRYIVQAFGDARDVGLYSAGYTVGLAINALAIAPFTLAWGAAYWEIARQANARDVIARVLTGFVAVAALVALALGALATDAIRILLTPDFEDARFVTLFSAFAYVFYGVFTIATTGLALENQTRRVPLVMGTAAAANVVLNLALVPLIGFMGAAVSTLASYALLAVLGGIVSQRYYLVPWELRRVAALLALAMGLAAAAVLGPDHIAWRLLCVAVYPVAVVGLRIVPSRLLERLMRLLKRETT